MAYIKGKRTVSCTYCGGVGHNRSTCKSLENYVESVREKHGDDNIIVQHYDAKKKKRQQSNKTRSCSYCDEQGHNRATCGELKEHMQATKEENATFRRRILEAFRRTGFGVGALISSEQHKEYRDYTSNDYFLTPYVITKINWENINQWNNDYFFYGTKREKLPYEAKNIARLSYDDFRCHGWVWDEDLLRALFPTTTASSWITGEHWRYNNRWENFCKVISPISTVEPPVDWLEGGSIKVLKGAYAKRQSWQGPMLKQTPA